MLQDDVNVTESRISGKLYLVAEDQVAGVEEGHYLALKYEVPENTTVTYQITGGTAETASGGSFAVAVTDPLNQKLKITAAADDMETTEKTYRLTGLRLLATAAPVASEP